MGSIYETNNQPHVVCIPFPAQGHVNPFMLLAKLLHSRGFYITFVLTEFNHSRLIRSKGPEAVKNYPGFRFETIPDGVPPSNPDATQSVTELLHYTKKHSVAPLRDLINKLNSMEDLPPIGCIISDGIMCFAIKVARELGIPVFEFWTASACGLLAYLQFGNLVQKDIFPLKGIHKINNYLIKLSFSPLITELTYYNNIYIYDLVQGLYPQKSTKNMTKKSNSTSYPYNMVKGIGFVN